VQQIEQGCHEIYKDNWERLNKRLLQEWQFKSHCKTAPCVFSYCTFQRNLALYPPRKMLTSYANFSLNIPCGCVQALHLPQLRALRGPKHGTGKKRIYCQCNILSSAAMERHISAISSIWAYTEGCRLHGGARNVSFQSVPIVSSSAVHCLPSVFMALCGIVLSSVRSIAAHTSAQSVRLGPSEISCAQQLLTKRFWFHSSVTALHPYRFARNSESCRPHMMWP